MRDRKSRIIITWIGPVTEDNVLVTIFHEVLNVTHFVVNGHKVFLVHSGAHLDSANDQDRISELKFKAGQH